MRETLAAQRLWRCGGSKGGMAVLKGSTAKATEPNSRSMISKFRNFFVGRLLTNCRMPSRSGPQSATYDGGETREEAEAGATKDLLANPDAFVRHEPGETPMTRQILLPAGLDGLPRSDTHPAGRNLGGRCCAAISCLMLNGVGANAAGLDNLRRYNYWGSVFKTYLPHFCITSRRLSFIRCNRQASIMSPWQLSRYLSHVRCSTRNACLSGSDIALRVCK